MYEEFYGFQAKPFSLVPDPDFLYLSSKHRMALTYLEYALVDKIGFVLLTGSIGVGKTTTLKQLLARVGNDTELAVVFNTNVSSEELLELILREFELESPAARKTEYLEVLNQFLIKKYGEGKQVVLIIDEAQNLSREALEEVRMISNLQTDKDLLLQVVLVGQPGLRTTLQHPSLAQLHQRIVVSYHLAALNLEETEEYIRHRLRKASGQDMQLFTPEAIERVFQHSDGIPRIINILGDAALIYGYADEMRSIDEEVVDRVVADRQETGLFHASPTEAEKESLNAAVQDNGNLQGRLHDLEGRVASLSVVLERQILDHERREESYKDLLIDRLERLIAEERRRSDALLVKWKQLQNEMKSAQGMK